MVAFVQVAAVWHQLAVKVMEFIAPGEEVSIPDKDLPRVEELQFRTLSDQKGTSLSDCTQSANKLKLFN